MFSLKETETSESSNTEAAPTDGLVLKMVILFFCVNIFILDALNVSHKLGGTVGGHPAKAH